jgi:hypothetical protein
MHIDLLKSRVREFLTGKVNERKKLLPVRWSHCNNARKRWTDKDIDDLVLRRAREEPWQRISESLGRSVSAVSALFCCLIFATSVVIHSTFFHFFNVSANKSITVKVKMRRRDFDVSI